MNLVRFLLGQYRRVSFGLAFLAAVIAVGTGGYMLVEGWPFLDALYMSVITITTVGYREVAPLSGAGKVFTIGLILSGVGSAFYILTALAATIIEGDLRQVFGERRMKSTIEQIKDHYIVCGYGRVGEEISREFMDRRVPFVLIDRTIETVERARRQGMLVVEGDATTEEALVEAGIHRCRALIAASDSDSGNTYTILTAKGLRPDVFIVARVGSPNNEAKLRQAGADRIVSPYAMGGRRMALTALQPMMIDFVDVVTAGPRGDRILAELAVDDESGLAGRTVGEAFANCKDVVVLAIRAEKGDLRVGPAADTRLAQGDQIMVFGSEQEVRSLGPLSRTDGRG